MTSVYRKITAVAAGVIFLFGCTPGKEYPAPGGNWNTGGSEGEIDAWNLTDWSDKPSVDPIVVGRHLAERFVEIPNSNWGSIDKSPSSFVTYPDVCAYLGAFWYAEAAGDTDVIQQLVDKYNDVITGVSKQANGNPLVTDLLWRHESNRVDYYIFGAIALHIASIMDDPAYSGVTFHETKESYLKFGLQYADSQWEFFDIEGFNARFNSPEYNKTGKLFKMSKSDYDRWKSYADRGYSWQTRLWIDDMFMITALQVQAYFASGNKVYLDRAVHEMRLYLDELPGDKGLYYHSPSAKFYWARGNGWMAVGMTEMLRILAGRDEYAEDRNVLMNKYISMMSSLLKYQKSDGLWAQLVDYGTMWTETSGSAMFAYAFIQGVANGWLDELIYGTASRRAWKQLNSYLRPNYDIREVCEGTGAQNSKSWYENRKRLVGDTHGQAGMLWCAFALTDLKKKTEPDSAGLSE